MPKNLIRVGLPYPADTEFAAACRELGARTMISMGALYRPRQGFLRIGPAAWTTRAMLDSAGFVAMVKGGYRWTVPQYVRYVATNNGEEDKPFPWEDWSAMDFCCEEQIARDRAEIDHRIDLTISTYGEMLRHLQPWEQHIPRPLPILQGRLPEDYLRCLEGLLAILGAYPKRFGVGSVCRRAVGGEEGLLSILSALDAVLPADVGLHLFGAKGKVLEHIRESPRSIHIDSMAWDFEARHACLRAKIPYSTTNRAKHLRSWFLRQQQLLRS